jgi:hypothetical protein
MYIASNSGKAFPKGIDLPLLVERYKVCIRALIINNLKKYPKVA